MPTYLAPGIYVEERSSGSKPIEGTSTSVAAFVGVTEKGPVGEATLVTSFGDFIRRFGGPIRIIQNAQEHYLYYAVAHFFAQGGTKCYIVRAVSYTDPDDPNTIEAIAATATFDGADLNDVTVSPAIRVSAINEGNWGETLEVQVTQSSKFSLPLAADLNTGINELTLPANTDVVIGSVLTIVEAVNGVVQSIDDTTKEIVFEESFSDDILANKRAFTPDFALVTTTTQGGTDASPDPPTGVRLASITKSDNSKLRRGDAINFVLGDNENLVVVTKIDTVDGNMIARFDPPSTKDFAKAKSRAYARDFTIKVRSDDGVIEEHPFLSPVKTDAANFVNVRLGQGSRESLLITAQDEASTDVVLVDGNSVFTPLLDGDDGLANLSDASFIGSELLRTGLHALDRVKDASILCIPNASRGVTVQSIAYCDKRKSLLYIIDQPGTSSDTITDYLNFSSTYAAIYHPWIVIEDPFTKFPVKVPPSGAIAGVYAKTDIKRGVHKAPAGTDTGILNVAAGVDVIVTKDENDVLYKNKINVIRVRPEGIVVWGTRTISAETEWKYINVRRLFIFLEQSIEQGTQWVAFEPNDTFLWKSIERNVSAFLRLQWREGKFAGQTEERAFYVKCDEETNPPEVVDAGQVITEIGVAPSKPAEFVIFRIKQFAGGTESA